jgi:hypothetical protein
VSHRINNTNEHLSLAALEFHVASTDDRGAVFDASTLQVKCLISLETDVADCVNAENWGRNARHDETSCQVSVTWNNLIEGWFDEGKHRALYGFVAGDNCLEGSLCSITMSKLLGCVCGIWT